MLGRWIPVIQTLPQKMRRHRLTEIRVDVTAKALIGAVGKASAFGKGERYRLDGSFGRALQRRHAEVAGIRTLAIITRRLSFRARTRV